jgi:hypothetical protein
MISHGSSAEGDKILHPLVAGWLSEAIFKNYTLPNLVSSTYGTPSMRRTEASLIHRCAKKQPAVAIALEVQQVEKHGSRPRD